MSDRETLIKAVGEADAFAVLRLLDGCALCALVDAADGAGQDWPEWARAGAVLQRWTEARGIAADARRKIGYLSCAAEGLKAAPAAMRPPLAQAVADFLATHGFAVDA
jgi:hypothetical protein